MIIFDKNIVVCSCCANEFEHNPDEYFDFQFKCKTMNVSRSGFLCKICRKIVGELIVCILQ